MGEFKGHIRLTRVGTAQLRGRAVETYIIELRDDVASVDSDSVVLAATGKVKIDTQTGFPLEVELKGKYTRAREGQPTVTVEVKNFSFSVKDFGKVADIRPPRNKSKPKSDQDTGKKIVKLVKDSKLKIQAAIQGDVVRISGKKRDDLQTVMARLRKAELGIPLQFINYRD